MPPDPMEETSLPKGTFHYTCCANAVRSTARVKNVDPYEIVDQAASDLF
jgi:hypothetical protein